MKELVTILLPTYNGQKYIKQMLDSIYFQDYRPIEVIISDDASQDDTISIINNWLENRRMDDISFKVIRNLVNKGLSGNISRAAKYIHGKYFFLADQDDIWEINKVSAQIEYLEKNEDCIMCICDRSIINENNTIVCLSLFQYNYANIRKRDYQKVLDSAVQYPANCMCVRAEHLRNIFPIPEQIVEHDTFIAIMATHYGKVGYLKKALTLYRIHDNNLSKQYELMTTRNLFKIGHILLEGYKRNNKRECIDSSIIEIELKKRFREKPPQWSKNIYPGKINHMYLKLIQDLFKHRNIWKKFIR